jgi:hypothetical protein
VSSLWADEKIYWLVNFEPYTPSHHFEGGKNDPKFRTKLKIASRLVELSVQEGIPFRAVVADSFYGEDEGFKQSLSELGVGYVVALKPSHAWWHKIGEIGSPYEAAGGYQARSDIAIRRHWQVVCCAFTFCWWAYGRLPTEEMAETDDDPPADWEERGKKEAQGSLARDLEGGKGVAGAVDHAQAILEGILRDAPATGAKSAA